AQANQWEEVIRLLETSTTQGQVPVFSGRVPIRWLVAEAYQRLGRLGEAAQHFELVLSPTSLGNEELLYLRGIPFSFAHQRLVLLYSRMGRLEDARRHWQIFQETFSNPDPELVPMIEEAREAITALEAKV
ncbi:MAG: tol-pal system YbgF family protein, partial [Candidatus Krumholzibacteriia bacterium]